MIFGLANDRKVNKVARFVIYFVIYLIKLTIVAAINSVLQVAMKHNRQNCDWKTIQTQIDQKQLLRLVDENLLQIHQNFCSEFIKVHTNLFLGEY